MANTSFIGFKSFIEKQQTFSEQTWNLLANILEFHSIRKNEITLEQGQTCRFIDYIDQGSFRVFHNNDGEELTTALYLEGACLTNMVSLTKGEPSKQIIQANEDSKVVRLYKEKLIALYEQSSELQSIGRSVLESMVIEENSWKEMYTLYNPEERYEFLTRKTPEIILRFPLQHIASFLGIRRETLSRIRSKKR